MARGDGSVYLQPGSAVYWCCYSLRGKPYRQSTGERDVEKARKFLKNKIKEVHAAQIGARPLITPAIQRATIGDLLARLKTKYELHIPRQDSPQNLSVIKRATADFGERLAVGLDAAVFDEYKTRRLAEGDALASIQRVLQMIRSAYHHARKHDRFPAHEIPFIGISKENNVRKDAYSEAEFQLILKELPRYLKDFALFGFRTGMRSGEIKSLRWENVKGDVIELAGADAKGDGSDQNARLIPLVGRDLAGILERRTKARQVKGKGKGAPSRLAEYFLHHNGNPIVDYRKAWDGAIKRAGVRRLVFHTARHSAIRMMDDAKISRDAIMAISGHRTQSMLSRYNVSSTARLRTALEAQQEYAAKMATAEAPGQNIVAMKR